MDLGIEIPMMIGCSDRVRTQQEVRVLFNTKHLHKSVTVSEIEKKSRETHSIEYQPKTNPPTINENTKLKVLLVMEENLQNTIRQLSKDQMKKFYQTLMNISCRYVLILGKKKPSTRCDISIHIRSTKCEYLANTVRRNILVPKFLDNNSTGPGYIQFIPDYLPAYLSYISCSKISWWYISK